MVAHQTFQVAQATRAAAPDAAEVAILVRFAGNNFPPLFPLDAFVAVNPLLGFEDRPFEAAVKEAAALFGARAHLPLQHYRKRLADGAIDSAALREALIERLGGPAKANRKVARDFTAADIALARLTTGSYGPAPNGDLIAAARALVEDAPADLLARLGPISVKPLTVLETASPTVQSAADGFVARWAAAFFDRGAALVAMPGRDRGLYRAVLDIASHDPDLAIVGGRNAAETLRQLPTDPLEAVADALGALDVAPSDRLTVLSRLLARLPGWAAHVRWRTDYADASQTAGNPAGFADLAALWLAMERLARGGTGLHGERPARDAADAKSAIALAVAKSAAAVGLDHLDLRGVYGDDVALFVFSSALSEAELAFALLAATETTYRANLLASLTAPERTPSTDAGEVRPDAQVLFCIDVRSEPMRSALEARGAYQTFGYAGFFGIPMALTPHGTDRRQKLLPVLLGPKHEVKELPAADQPALAASTTRAARRDSALGGLFDTLKKGVATAFATAETVGPAAGIGMIARTMAPITTDRIVKRLNGRASAADAFRPSLDFVCDAAGASSGFTLDERVFYAEALLSLTGFPKTFAPIVVLAGHGSSTVNNPYGSALDCGACGGNHGGANARVMAQIFNDPDVRARLAAGGHPLPADTVFIAAEHDTTTDGMTIFDRALIPASHAERLARLETDVAAAGAANRIRRAGGLGAKVATDLLTRASDWAEVRPEWALARNAAFIVGERRLTQGLPLDGRAFLHSYDWRIDPEGKALAIILTAPMVVAEWINTQYFFSTLDNERYGSGSKVTQNIVGGLGVVQGNGGDLRVGFPRQSVIDDDGRPYHEPMRLTTVVHAPVARVAAVVAAHGVLKRLFGNGWVALVVIDPNDGRVLRLGPKFDWISLGTAQAGTSQPGGIATGTGANSSNS